MDDPPQAHRCVQAGKPAPAWGRRGMPALPGGASADRVDLPGETQDENRCGAPPRIEHGIDSD